MYDVKPAETGQLQYISQLVMMSGTKREEAWVCLKKLIGITDEQEQRIRGALERMRNPHPLNHYCKKEEGPLARQINQAIAQGEGGLASRKREANRAPKFDFHTTAKDHHLVNRAKRKSA